MLSASKVASLCKVLIRPAPGIAEDNGNITKIADQAQLVVTKIVFFKGDGEITSITDGNPRKLP